MKTSQFLIICTITLLGSFAGGNAWQALELGDTLTGAGTSGSPLEVNVPNLLSDGAFTTGFESADRHWWSTNLSATGGNKTHDANNRTSTVNELGGWNMYSGLTAQGTFNFDSSAFVCETPNSTLTGTDGLFLYGDGDLMPAIVMTAAGEDIVLRTSGGEVEIENLSRSDTRADVVGINAATGKLYLKDASIIETQTPASAGATGTTGDIAWDASYIYVCTATNTWKRVSIATW